MPRGSYAVKAAYARHEPAVARAAAVDVAPLSAPAQPGVAALRRSPALAWAAAGAAMIAACGMAAFSWYTPAAEPPRVEVSPERAHRTRIAVVPLENLGGAAGLDRLAAGLTEEIMLRLDDLDLFVIATQAKWYGPGAPLDGVLGMEHSYVLTGSVRDQSGTVRVTVRIIEAETGTQIWSAAYDEPPSIEDEPELQATVARDVAGAAAPFGPVFDAELALARRAAHYARAARL